ncbi:hypothetical protein [Pimelobacter simplex]|uniref:hypothetical protein n=1 Tax=Nocardioides simplex TaxID=2045 RepID=UPI003AAE6DC5
MNVNRDHYDGAIEALAREIDAAVCEALRGAGLDPSDDGLGMYDWTADAARQWATVAFDEAIDTAVDEGWELRSTPQVDVCVCCLAPLDVL